MKDKHRHFIQMFNLLRYKYDAERHLQIKWVPLLCQEVICYLCRSQQVVLKIVACLIQAMHEGLQYFHGLHFGGRQSIGCRFLRYNVVLLLLMFYSYYFLFVILIKFMMEIQSAVILITRVNSCIWFYHGLY